MRPSLFISFLSFTFLIAGCGREQSILNPQNPGSSSPTTDVPSCTISEVTGVGQVQTCPTRMAIIDNDGNVTKVLSRTIVTDAEVLLLASKKNGGTGGSQLFNASVSLSPPRNFRLPTVLNILEGNSGNGQKLYLTFNDGLSCAYYSHAGNKYRNPRCFQGATQTPQTSSGFTGGTEVTATLGGRLNDISYIQMSVNGASGNGVITRVQITL